MKKYIIIFTIFALASFPLLGEGAGDFINTGDFHFRKGEYKKAVKNYQKAVDRDPENAMANFKLGRAYNYLAERRTGKKKNKCFKNASKHLSKASRLDSDIAKAHLELAKALGKMGLFKQSWSSYSLAKRVHEEIKQALERDEELSEAYFLLGLWNMYVSIKPFLQRKPLGLGDASLKNAIKSFKKGLKHDQGNLKYKLHLAKAYKRKKEKQKSRKLLQEITDAEKNKRNKHVIFKAQKELDELSN